MQKARIAQTLGAAMLAALFASGSWAQSSSAPDASATKSRAASDTAKAPASSGSTGTATAMRKGDQKMLVNLAQGNLAEIKAGEMALKKSQNADVKKFAQKMIDDHTAASKEVQKLAEAKGVTLPTEMDTKHKAMSAALEKLDGDKFDRTYMSQGGVSDHKKTHKLVQDIQKNAKDSDLKALAAKLQPTIDEHLKMAEGMKDNKADQKSSGSSGSAGKSGSGSK